jgi:small subunit ribosomal protein S16
MLRIKLARFGKKNQPHYRIVVTERKSKRDGQYQALLGTYVPTQEPKILHIDMEAVNAWLVKGAQPTDTVQNLIERFKSGNPFPAKKARPSKKAQAKATAQKAEAAAAKEAAAAPTEPVAPAEVTEAPVAEEKAAE